MNKLSGGLAPMIVEVPLRWGDMDAQGHVNNAGISDYLQEARVDFLLTGENAYLLEGGVVVTQHCVSYRRPVVFSSDPVEIEVAPTRVGAARFSVGYHLRHRGEICASALTTLCPFDFDAGAPRRLSPAEKAWFNDRLWDGVELPALSAAKLQGRGHSTPIRVRWSDVDSYGHVNNVRFFDYVQEARIKMTTDLDPAMARSGMDDSTDIWLVARQDIDYLAQMEHRMAPYQVLTGVATIGTTSLTLAAEIVDPLADDAVLARGRTVLVRADSHGRPTPLSDHTRELLANPPW